jgi:hypothetical protein
MLYRIFNEGDFKNLGSGWRTVIALPPGRKWITLVDWTTLDVQDVLVKEWESLQRREIVIGEKRKGVDSYRKGVILETMLAQLAYVDETKAIRDAISLLKAA